MAHAGDRDVLLLHGLQQGRLGARAGAVDFVGHQQLAEDRALHEAELPAALVGLFEDFGADDVGGHQVGGELDAALVKAENTAERGRKLGLGKTGRADQQGMATRQNGGERELDHFLLAENDLANGFPDLYQAFARPLEAVQGLGSVSFMVGMNGSLNSLMLQMAVGFERLASGQSSTGTLDFKAWPQ